ncbi:MAG: D-alanine--D-alanine ligase, partial [Pseudomonadota bacterium]
MKKHVVVLKGGMSVEREVSLSSAKAISVALNQLGYRVSEIDAGHDVAARLAEIKPDIAFNALHGRFGEDGAIQGLLEIMQIPYTHSGVLASALAMDKVMAKKIFAAAGLNVAEGKIVHKSELLGKDPIARPYV